MNNSWLTFDPVFSVWIVALLTLPLFAFSIWKEINRPHKFLFARIIALFIILVSILGLLIRPSYQEQRAASSIILLTPGYDKLKVDSLVKENNSFKIIRTNEADPYKNSEVLTSHHNLSKAGGDLGIVVGQGLPDYALELMHKKSFKFFPSDLPVGFIELLPPKPAVVNKKSFIKGTFNASEKTLLKLLGPAGVEDSVTLQPSGQFSLSFKPKQAGLFVYTLIAQSGASKMFREKLPVEIFPEQTLRILILQKFPTAEIRTLKNYLAEHGHSLALRYQTSKTNFKYEYANLNPIRINQLTTELADAFDLIFLDNIVLDEFNTSEKTVMENAIHAGLGVIILTDDFSEKGKSINRFLPVKTKMLTTDTVHIRLPESKSRLYTLTVLPTQITPDASIQSITSHKDRILSGYIFKGAGKVGFQLLKETYRISLEGKADDYAFIWSDLIEKTARAKNDQFKMNLTTDFPYYADEPLSVEIISSGIQPSLYADKRTMPLIEDVIIDDYWHGKSWAGKPGWHQFTTQDSTHLNYFVSNDDEWRTLRIANQIRINKLVEAEDYKEKVATQFISKPIPAVLFYIIFLFACGFLWLAPKL